MALKSTLLVCLIICCQISHVTAVSECTSAIVASVFGTIGVILLIAGIAALVWYCRQKRSGKLSSKSSVESASEPEISLGTKAKGGQVGLNGHGTPVTFSHHYKEEAPSVAYNTKGVVNPAFGGQREVLIDMPSKEDGEVKIDMDGDGRFELPSSKEGEVKIDMGGGAPHKDIPTTKGDINLDMDIDLGMNVSNGSSPKMSSRDAELPDVEFHRNKPSGISFPGGDVPGADTDFVFEGSSTPTFDVYGPKNMETIDVDLDRPESGGFGLLIARDKTLPPPALFVREVTPGGVAARTGLVDKGDKIVGINGTPIEGLAHDKAMRLLRNDDNPRLKLTLLKNSSLERNGSLNLPERSLDLSKTIDKSCTIDVEPGLEAGIPSLDVEGFQGSADLGETETSLNISEFDGDSPQVRIARPNMNPHSLQGSSSNLNLPSPKTKRAKCFSCLSKGDRGEPYTKGNTSDRLDWDRPSADRSSQGRLKAQLSGPHVDASAGKFKGSKTNVNVSPAGELPSSKKKRGNCFSCAGDGDKSDPYKKTKGDVGIDLSSPDGSTEMVEPRNMDITASAPDFHERGETNGLDPRTTRPDFDIEGPNKGISTGPPEISLHAKDPTINTPDVSIPSGSSDIGLSGAGDIFSKRPKAEIEANSPDIDGLKGKLDTDISIPDADISHGDLRGPRAQIDAPSGKLNLPSSKRKRGNCLSCAGDADKDDPYRKTQGSVDYNLRCPDGSLEMERPGKLDISASAPDFQGRGKTKDLSFNSTGPNFDVRGPNKGISTEMQEISLHANDPSVGTPDVSFPSGDIDISHSGAGDLSSKRPKVGIEANSPDIDGPKGRCDTDISAPEADISHGKLRGPGAQVNTPSGKFNFPSIKKKRGTCLSCTGDGDKDDPYRKTQGNVGYDFSGPDGSMEMENRSKVDIKAPGADFQGHAETNDMSLKITKPDFDIEGPNWGISTGPPEISLHTKDPSINNPEVSFPSGSTNISLSGEGDISSKRPEVEIEANSPDIDGPKGRFNTDISAPSVDVSQGKLRGPTAEVKAPSGQLNVPSTKRKGINCLSCAGDGVKDDPYRKTKGSVGLPQSGPDGSLEMETPRRVDIKAPGADFQGHVETNDRSLKITKPDSDIEGPNWGISTGPPEISLHPKDPSINNPDVSFPSGSTNISLSGAGDISYKRPEVDIEATSPDIDGPKGRFNTEIAAPGVDVSQGKLRSPTGEVNAPSGQFNVPSTKRKGVHCLSCAGDGDKDDPYKKTKRNVGFDQSGPDGSLRMEKPRKADMSASVPDFQGREKTKDLVLKTTGPDFDIEGANKEVSTGPPEISLHTKDPSINTPDMSFPSGSTNIDLSGAGDISSKRPKIGIEANSPDTDGPKGRFDTGISAPEADMSHGKIKGPRAEANTPPGQLNLPSTKRKGVNCVSCKGDGDKDDPYRKTQGNVGYDFSGPDRSMEMENRSKVDIKAPGADFQGHTETNDTSLKITKPDFDIERPNRGISTGPPEISLHTKDPSINNPDVSFSSRSTNISLSGEGDISSKRPEVEIEANSPDIDGPKGRFNTDISAPSVDVSQGKLRGPTAEVNAPSGQLNVPSTKRKGVNCLLCAGDGDKDDPYRKTKGSVGLPQSGPDGSLEMESASAPDFQGREEAKDTSLKTTGPDYDIEGPTKGVSIRPPEISLHAKDSTMSTPNVSIPSGTSDIGLSGTGEVSSKRPRVEIAGNSLDIDGPKGRFDTDSSAPDAGISHGKPRDPRAQVNAPSGQLNLPSKNRKGVNCLSCAGDGDKGDPYKKTKENVGIDLGSPDGSLEMVEPSKIDITASAPDFHERGETNSLDLRATGTDFDIQGPSKGVSTEPPEISLHAKDPSINTSHISIPSGSNNIGLSGAGDISSKRPKAEIEANSPDIDEPEGRLDTHLSAPDADVSHGKLKDPRAQVDAPSGELNLPSTKRKGVNCLSCAGYGDKDDPYRKTKGSVGSNLSGPDGSLEIAKPRKVDITASAPDFQGRDKTKDLSFKSTGPDFNVRGPNKGISTGIPEISYDAKDPDATIPSGSTDISLSGAGDISSKRPKVKIDSNSPLVEGAEGRFDTEISGPDVEISTAKLRGPRAQVTALSGFSTGPPEISHHGKDPSLNTPDVSIPSGSIGISLPGAGDVASKQPIFEAEANSPAIDEPEGRFETDISAPDVDVSHGKLQGPKAQINVPSGDLNLPSSKKKRVNCLSCAGDGEKDDPYKKTRGSIGFNLNGPDRSLEVEKPSKVEISTSGPDFDGRKNTTGLELSTITPDVDIQGPKNGISLEPPDISENSLDTATSAEKLKIGLNSPEFKDPTIVASGFDAPKVSYETPRISGPSLGRIVDDTDAQSTKFDLDASDIDKPDFGSETPGRGAGIRDIKIPDFSLSGPSIGREDKDVDINGFDLNVNASRVSAEKQDISNPSFDATAGDIDFEGVHIPSADLKLTGFDIPKPGGKEMHRTKPDIFMPSVDGMSVDTPAVDLRQRLEAHMKGLDVEPPDSDFTVPSPNKNGASLELVDMKGLKGKSFEGDVDWGISTSTPKDSGSVKYDTNVVEGDIEVVQTYDNMELNSTPESFPSVSYDEPRSLQRYDEIRPEMELRLLSPKQPKESDPNFNADIPDANLDLDNWKPREMSLVKVEENVTVCSASVLEPSSPRRTLTLDREIKQRIELELPGHEGLDTPSSLKKKSSSSSSSSSSSDSEDDKEKKSKRKKKSKLPKVFRKNSNSSASSKESSERKLSKRSSSSDDDDKDQNRPSTDFVPELNLKSKTRSSSSSSNEGSFDFYHHDLPNRGKSKKSSSSSDEGKENYRKKQTYKVDGETFTSVDGGIEEPGKSGSIVVNVEHEVTYNLSRLDGKISSKKQKPTTSSSSSSDEEISRYNVSELNDLQKAKDQAIPESKRVEDDLASSLDLSHHQYKVVDNVISHDFAPKAQDTNPSGVQEDPFVIVSRSLKRPYQESEHEDEVKVSSIEVQFSEPSEEVSNFLDYPCRVSEVEEDDGAHVQEEGVVPVFKPRSLDYDIPDVLVLSEPSEENSTRDLLSSDQKGRVSPAWDIQAHTFENVAHVTIRDDPPMRDENNEIREQSLIVVTRSLKRTSPIIEDADDGLVEKPLNFSNTLEVQFTEPTHDFYLEYPEKNKVFMFDEENDQLIDEERISQHTKEREIPDISAQLNALNHTEDEPRLKSDLPTKTEDHDKSPKEKGPKEISRRGSNSRLWDLMQGYLIEQPILSDDVTNSESRPKNTEEHNKERDHVSYETKPIEIKDKSVSEETHQSLNVVTYQIHIDDHQSPKDLVNTISTDGSDVVEVDTASKPDLVSFDTKPVEETRVATSYTTSITKMESSIAYVNLAPVMTETDLESDAVDQLDLTKDEYHTSVTDVKSSVQEVRLTSHSSQIEPISLHVDAGAIKPVSKYQTTSWKKEISVPADVDDKNDDPWMRHYSRGLQQGTPYQPLYAKSPGRESSLGEKRGLSLSKVPHVKGVKTTVEKQRERPRYSIEGRTSIQSASYQVSTDGKSMPRELETVPRVRTPEILLSGRDDREQSEKSQPESAGADPSKGTSTSGSLVQSLRSLWDK